MKPWVKETLVRNAAKWIYDHPHNNWYTPFAITKENPERNLDLPIDKATEVFQEMAERGVLKPVLYRTIWINCGFE